MNYFHNNVGRVFCERIIEDSSIFMGNSLWIAYIVLKKKLNQHILKITYFCKLREKYKVWTGESLDDKELISFGLVDDIGLSEKLGNPFFSGLWIVYIV